MGCLRKLILGKQKLVRYALDVDKVEFDLLQDPECHGFHYVNVGLILGGLGFVLPLGNGILMKMWQYSVR
uniref:Transmembrane protein n=1 Tax=Fagus sylvatica TaxID=28930 RepID=A0A2N9GUU9_FAGSY